MRFDFFQRISRAPTNPHPAPKPREFDVAGLYRGPVAAGAAAPPQRALDETLRQADFWIVSKAIISPHYDIGYNDGPAQRTLVGDARRPLTLPSAQSYSSCICCRCSPLPRAANACSWAAPGAARPPAPARLVPADAGQRTRALHSSAWFAWTAACRRLARPWGDCQCSEGPVMTADYYRPSGQAPARGVRRRREVVYEADGPVVE